MKKKLIALLLAVSTVSYSLDTYVRAGVITNTNQYSSESGKFENYAPTVNFEIIQNFLLADLGAGIAYNGGISEIQIETVPVYGIVKVNLFPIAVKPYLVGKLGRIISTNGDSPNYKNSEGQLYSGLGLGMDILSLQGELLYSITRLKNEYRDSESFNQLSITIGYKF